MTEPTNPDQCACGHPKTDHFTKACIGDRCSCRGFVPDPPLDMVGTLRRWADSESVRRESRSGRSMLAGADALEQVPRLRFALLEIVGALDPHHDHETGGDHESLDDCFCPRCLAVRALRPLS